MAKAAPARVATMLGDFEPDAVGSDAGAANGLASLHALFPLASAELLRLVQAAEENANLARCDLHAMRDWLEGSNYDESLHLALVLLVLAYDEGSLCIELAEKSLARRLEELTTEAEAARWARRLAADFAGKPFDRLIGKETDNDRPVVRVERERRSYLYFQKLLFHEQAFVQALHEQRQRNLPVYAPDLREAVLRTVSEDCPVRSDDRPLLLDARQRQAVQLALDQPLAIISGGPGTGKTSIVLAVLRCLVRLGMSAERIALAAPTGRAAQRLADAIRAGLDGLAPQANGPDQVLRTLQAATLHHLLEYSPSRNFFRRHRENPLDADVVIVDECSMVGIGLMAALFQALGPATRLILLGDKDQLPSVDAGAVLASLIPDDARGDVAERGDIAERGLLRTEQVILLQTNHRSEEQIRAAAAAINRQESAALDQVPLWTASSAPWASLHEQRGVRLFELTEQSPAELRRIVHRWAESAFIDSGYANAITEYARQPTEGLDAPVRQLIGLLDMSRILTLVREGPWGCVAINECHEQILRPRLGARAGGVLFPGAPVLITRNDPVRELYNGDVGIALPAPVGGLRVAFSRAGDILWCPADALPAWELGFSLTVHKSQGSEYGRVLLVLPPAGGQRLLRKELLYTGLTRARELAVLCATRAALCQAIARKCLRESGILRA